MARQHLAHTVEKATACGFAGIRAGEFPDTCIRALERFILHKHRLHERVDCVRRAGKPVSNCTPGFRIPRCRLKPRESIKQLVNQLAFLWGHAVLP
jgi:hypothetical protein